MLYQLHKNELQRIAADYQLIYGLGKDDEKPQFGIASTQPD